MVSLINLKAVPKIGFSFDDKIYHLGAYIILGFLWVYSAIKEASIERLKLACILTLCYGVVMELIQHQLNPMRTFDVVDMLFNCLGVIFGTIIAKYFYRMKVKLN